MLCFVVETGQVGSETDSKLSGAVMVCLNASHAPHPIFLLTWMCITRSSMLQGLMLPAVQPSTQASEDQLPRVQLSVSENQQQAGAQQNPLAAYCMLYQEQIMSLQQQPLQPGSGDPAATAAHGQPACRSGFEALLQTYQQQQQQQARLQASGAVLGMGSGAAAAPGSNSHTSRGASPPAVVQQDMQEGPQRQSSTSAAVAAASAIATGAMAFSSAPGRPSSEDAAVAVSAALAAVAAAAAAAEAADKVQVRPYRSIA